jgi:hypothetical protein
LETRNYSKAEIEIISVDDFDGKSQIEYKERNIIREKTFNRELHSLVSQIYLNEELNDKQLNYSDALSDSEINSLLMRCENLIYRLKHFNDLPVISSFYNPFKIELADNDYMDYINEGLAQCGFSKYQILKYNFSDKAYKSSINNIDPSFTDTVFFSINDPLLLYLGENKEGFIIKSDLINSNPFFSKKFTRNHENLYIEGCCAPLYSKKITRNDDNISSFYIVKISSIFDGSIESQLLSENINNFEHLFSPLLLIELKHGEDFQPKDIFKKLKEFSAIPFLSYFFKNSIKLCISYCSFEEVLLIIELFIKTNSHSNLISYMITLNDYSNKENIFILKFIISKIKSLLKKESLIFRVSINKIILIIPESKINEIKNITDKVNSHEEVLKVQVINNDYMINKEFIDFLLS